MVDITKVSNLNSLNTGSSGTKVVSGSATSGTSASATDKADQLRTQFLNILLTQMQNQNPLDPMDTKEFTGQLAQFSSLEQQINTNSKLDSLLTAMQSSASTSAFGYIGQDAELDSKMTTLENGTADWKYALNTNADTFSIKIKDSTGRVVYQKDERNVASGTYSLNAKATDFSYPVEEGDVLTLEITAKDSTGANVRTATSTHVTVDGVETGPEGISLRAGGLIFSLDNVLRFKSVTAPAETTTTA